MRKSGIDPKRSGRFSVAVVGTLSLAAAPALAHHAMDGETPNTLMQGLLSGVAHPVIGLDHLSVVLLLGAVCGALRVGVSAAFAFVVASVLGCAVHVATLSVPASEVLLGLSVIGVGVTALSGKARSRAWLGLVAATGLLHGYAYGESIVGAEATPLFAYLAGFALVQFALAVGVSLLVRKTSEQAQGALLPGYVRALSVACVAAGVMALYLGA